MKNTQVNNTLFERKHHYMNILRESEILKRQMNEELLYGNLSASRLDEVQSICNLAFAGLLQEGLTYRYEEDTDPAKNTYAITVDHVDYKCRASVLKSILKEHYAKFSLEREESNSEQGCSQEEKPKQKLSEEEPETVPETKEAESRIGAASSFEQTEDVEPVTLDSDTNKKGILEETLTDEEIFNQMLEELMEIEEKEAREALRQKELSQASVVETFAETVQESKQISVDTDDEKAVEEVKEEPVKKKEAAKEEESNKTIEEQDDQSTSTGQQDLQNTQTELPPYSVITPADSVKESVPSEEHTKHRSTFVYQTLRIMVLHEGLTKGDEITFMIAPLTIEENTPSCPIIIYAYMNGKAYYQSSFDVEQQRNTVKMPIGEYEFLIRGMFEHYKFNASVYTTGISASQNDQINVLSTKTYNTDAGRAKNGHIKFYYTTPDQNTATIEVFPLSQTENHVLVMRKDGELPDYYSTEFCTNIAVQTNDGMQEVVCVWEGDLLRAELVPFT